MVRCLGRGSGCADSDAWPTASLKKTKPPNQVALAGGTGGDDDGDDNLSIPHSGRGAAVTTTMPFGKHKGRALSALPGEYLEWLMIVGRSTGAARRLVRGRTRPPSRWGSRLSRTSASRTAVRARFKLSATLKTIIVTAVVRLSIWAWALASMVVRIWHGFRRA